MVDSSMLIGVAIGVGLMVVYSLIADRLMCQMCEKEGGRCEFRCEWFFFCRWVCLIPLKPLDPNPR
jgi:hypothetical protein